MTAVIDPNEPGREYVKVGPKDGAQQIWVMDWLVNAGPENPISQAGLHFHEGDEIFHVVSGTVRFHLDGQNLDVGAGRYVVVPANTVHGYRLLAPSRVQVIGQVGMGEWVLHVRPDGTTEEVEIRSNLVPWHRPPQDDEEFDLERMMSSMATTHHILDQSGEDHTKPLS
jgi:quercetin dioxygenase-like cupin family protein